MTAQELREARIERAAEYMMVDLESDRTMTELLFDAAYAYVTGGVCPDPCAADVPEVYAPGLFDLAVFALALHWHDHRDDMEHGAFPAALRPMLTQLKAQRGTLVG